MTRPKKFYNFMVFVALILSGVVAVIGYIFKDYNQDAERHQKALSVLTHAKDLDRVIDEDILLTRSFLLSNYDSLVWATDSMLKTCAEAQMPDSVLETSGPQVTASITDYCTAVARKLSVVEDFKSNNSILRNVRAYIPILIDQFQSGRFNEASDHLMIFVSRYFLEQTVANRASVEKAASWLSVAQRDRPHAEAARGLRSNIDILLKALKRRSELEDEIFSGSVRVRYQKLEADYLAFYTQAQSRAARFRVFLLILCGLLTVGLVYIFYRLNLKGLELADLNDTLEEKVENRTRALQEASQRLAENQQVITQTAKMSALGEMAGGIAHEINTPLAAILLSAELLEKEAKKIGSASIAEGLEGIIKTVQRISRIVIGLRRFTRDSSAERPRPCSTAEIIDDTMILCTEKFRKYGVAVKIVPPDFDAFVECVPDQIAQVILNLMNNSFDAIAAFPEKWIRIETIREGNYCQIAVTDCGGGISFDVQQKLMQPFFTTKEIGKGTGLGLSISKQLVEAQGGTLTYDPSSPNTRFVLSLPIYDEYRIA